MALSRAFTTKRNRPLPDPDAVQAFITRAASQRGGRPVLRNEISAPLCLMSTSNVLLNNAQPIEGLSPVEIRSASGSSLASSNSSANGDDSDATAGSIHSHESTDASSVEASPTQDEAEPNHLSVYFKPNIDTGSKMPSRSPSLSSPTMDTPRLPQRVPSHSKRAHEHVHRKRSVQRMLSPASSAREAFRDRAVDHSPVSPLDAAFVEAPRDAPFGQELAQLDEVAEEFGHVVSDAEAEADFKVIRSQGLAQFCASDYLSEIQGLAYAAFVEEPDMGGWI